MEDFFRLTRGTVTRVALDGSVIDAEDEDSISSSSTEDKLSSGKAASAKS